MFRILEKEFLKMTKMAEKIKNIPCLAVKWLTYNIRIMYWDIFFFAKICKNY